MTTKITAAHDFIAAFDALLRVPELDARLGERLIGGLFRVYAPPGGVGVSAYEAGIWHDPARGYVTNEKKLRDALSSRPHEIAALFSKGVIADVSYTLRAALTGEMPQAAYVAAIKLLSACDAFDDALS